MQCQSGVVPSDYLLVSVCCSIPSVVNSRSAYALSSRKQLRDKVLRPSASVIQGSRCKKSLFGRYRLKGDKDAWRARLVVQSVDFHFDKGTDFQQSGQCSFQPFTYGTYMANRRCGNFIDFKIFCYCSTRTRDYTGSGIIRKSCDNWRFMFIALSLVSGSTICSRKGLDVPWVPIRFQ